MLKHRSGWSLFLSGLAVALVFSAVVPGPWGEDARAQDQSPPVLKERLDDAESRIAELEDLLVHFSRDGDDIMIDGANLHVRNGTGSTAGTPNALGNVIIGYNELRGSGDDRSGSHMLVAGIKLNYSSFGGIVVGAFNTTRGDYACVSGGNANEASGAYSSVSGGIGNVASGSVSSVSGGRSNEASGRHSWVSGGFGNEALGERTSISGGFSNEASGRDSSVSGGFGNGASGTASSVGGGILNVASGSSSSVSGGSERSATGPSDWAAGSLYESE